MVAGLYIVTIGHKNGDVDHFGPFKTEARAKQYLFQAVADYQAVGRTVRGHVSHLIVPLVESAMLKWV